jgi:hypothetical protein
MNDFPIDILLCFPLSRFACAIFLGRRCLLEAGKPRGGEVCGARLRARLRQNKTLLSANQIGQTNTVIVVTSF